MRKDYSQSLNGCAANAQHHDRQMNLWLERCLLCGRLATDLVVIQEHVMDDHGYSQGDLRRATKREIERGFVWTMPDGRDWMEALRIFE